jgi:hypothetical protein
LIADARRFWLFLAIFRAGAITCAIVGLGISLVLLITEMVPPFLGYIHYHSSYYKPDAKLFNFFVRLISSIFTFCAMCPSMGSAQMVGVYEVFLTTISIRKYLVVLGEESKRKPFYSCLQQYRQLQIVLKLFNNLYQTNWFILSMGFASFGLIISGFCALKLHGVIPTMFVAYFGATAIGGSFMLTVVFSTASRIQTESAGLLETWNSNLRFRRDKRIIRILRSCDRLKAKLGSSNYIDQLTPFNIMSFNLDQTISLVLVQE